MKKSNLILAVVVSIFFLLPSCEKVIDLNLNTSASDIVIQGNVYDYAGPYTVSISKTVDFTQTNVFPPVTNAVVTISDNAGNSETLIQKTEGKYVTSTLRGIPGVTYTLKVVIQGKTYTASSTMPKAVNIDSIYLQRDLFGNGTEAVIDFTDPINVDNYYRVDQYVNDTLKSGFYVGDDKLYQGQKISFYLSASSLTGDKPLIKGDEIKLQLECIDDKVYEYFRTTKGNNGQSASPANPVSNISNGALGYFSAASVRQDSIRVP